MKKRWVIYNADKNQINTLASELGIKNLTAKILFNRGIKDSDTAQKFLTPKTLSFNDPLLMKDMQIAVDRIHQAITNHEKICVYGDYDVDGMCASVILIRALKKLNAEVDFYIPERSEGYGLNPEALKKIIEHGFKLLITVDCGISNEKEIFNVKTFLDVIVTDHHLPALAEINSAVAVINPKQIDCPYPEKNLSGAGVAFKLCQALTKKFCACDVKDYMENIELVALATVADIVPITGENRKIVTLGLKKISSTNCVGLRTLMNIINPKTENISEWNLGFQIAPNLNSVSRLQSPKEVLRLLLTESTETALSLAHQFNRINQKRIALTKKMLKEAEIKFKQVRSESFGDLYTIILSSPDWFEGLTGLIASKFVEHYNLPTIILATTDGEIYRGSCRSIPALNIKKALDSMSEFFEQYGGHSQAAGITIHKEKIAKFRKAFEDYVRLKLVDEDFEPVINVDASIEPSLVNIEFMNELKKFEPYGVGNPSPIFIFKNIKAKNVQRVGRDKAHLRFKINDELQAIAWNHGWNASIIEKEHIDFICELEVDGYQGKKNFQCKVLDFRISNDPQKNLSREQLVKIYSCLSQILNTDNRFDLLRFSQILNERTKENFSVSDLKNALEIFEELGLIEISEGIFNLPPPLKKLSLKNSRTFRLGVNRNEISSR